MDGTNSGNHCPDGGLANRGTLGLIKEVPIEAAHLLMSLSDLVWLFGSKHARWHTPHLMLAARHFGISLLPAPFQTAQQYEKVLFKDLLFHLHSQPTHRFLVLYRLASDRAGWVCLVPQQNWEQMQCILEGFQLRVRHADPAEVLQ